jgi:hypothetical protein
MSEESALVEWRALEAVRGHKHATWEEELQCLLQLETANAARTS